MCWIPSIHLVFRKTILAYLYDKWQQWLDESFSLERRPAIQSSIHLNRTCLQQSLLSRCIFQYQPCSHYRTCGHSIDMSWPKNNPRTQGHCPIHKLFLFSVNYLCITISIFKSPLRQGLYIYMSDTELSKYNLRDHPHVLGFNTAPTYSLSSW